jgi:hypothetical protein
VTEKEAEFLFDVMILDAEMRGHWCGKCAKATEDCTCGR